MIRFKVQCAGVIGHENRKERAEARPTSTAVEHETIGTFLFRTRTQADTCAAALRKLGHEPKLVRL